METGMKDMIMNTFSLPEVDIRTYSPLTLAYIGDAVYEIIIRTVLLGRGNASVNKLNQRATKLVKASAQKEMFHTIEDVLTEEEIGIYKRGRNAKSYSSAKNASVTEYRIATGLECLIGYLYMSNRSERAAQLLQDGFEKMKGNTL